MKARSAGAFILTFVALGYLVGEFEGLWDLLIVGVIAAAVGVAAAMWAERDEGKEPPDVFDERTTRRAVRRGVVRTALTAVVWVLVGLFALSTITGVWQTRGGRRDHFQLVAMHGFNAANPDYKPVINSGCCSMGLRSLELKLDAEPRSASGLATPARLDLKLDLRGRLEDEVSDLPNTGLSVAANQRPSRQQSRTLLARLPDTLVASAVVELAHPLQPAGMYTLLARHGVLYPDSEVPVYLQPRDYFNRAAGRGFDGTFFDNRVSWPSPSLAEFQHWTKQLRGSDDRLLDGLRLPSSKRLRELAADPHIYGFSLDRATPQQLRGLLADPVIQSVSIGDVAFDLESTG